MNELNELIKLLHVFKTPSYDKLPEIDLYMDQVLTYIKKNLPPFKDSDKDIITASMINNYVKDNVVKNPVDKKYDKEAIASLIMVANLKRVLPIQDIKSILSDPNDVEALYSVYQINLDRVIQSMLGIEASLTSDETVRKVALEFAIEASVKAYFAHMILSSDPTPHKERKKKSKSTQE
ncbi:DUF1836 domain-containing protein [Acholeplasma vituli]|uniref:DUF1836 domain-containing protein n=1 Tax=Paracholeplasma vituli TaxID=69473 RepID=A0ABT2PX59_9MOLU|nr:DUF1836 domain-containing protein [Paracholeplasma vituli]MCU0105425.1 DUF1836 domain-containing protein [Paracholeplasma vituli]